MNYLQGCGPLGRKSCKLWRMSLSAPIASPQVSRKPVHAAPKSAVGKNDFAEVRANVSAALAAYEAQPERDVARQEFRRSLRVASEAIVQFSRQQPQGSHVTEALALVRTVADSGVWDHPLEPTEIATMTEWSGRGWPGVLAR